MKNKKLLGFILALFVFSLINIAGSAAAATTYTIKAGFWFGDTPSIGKGANWFMTEVEKRTNGRVKFQRFWSNSLVKSAEGPDALKSGIADVVNILPSYYPGKMPLSTVMNLPCLTEDLWVMSMAIRDLYKMPAVAKELSAFGARYLSASGGAGYHVSSKKPIRSAADFKGLKLRALGYQAQLLERLGGVPVNIVAPEIYTAIERGTIDGDISTPSLVIQYSLQEVAKHYTLVPFGDSGIFMAIREAAWEKLPPDIQKIMEEVNDEHIAAYHRIYQIEGNGASLTKMKAAGVEIIAYPAADGKALQEIASKTIWDKWVGQRTADGLPAQEVLDNFKKLIDQYTPQSPFK
jgi:TRAP-type C4-dicarboxylate transport system substrate-binding protein